MKRKLVYIVLVGVISALLSGCCSKLNLFTVEDQEFKEQNIRGIQQSTNKKIDVIFIHGMGNYSAGDPERVMERIMSDLQLEITGVEPVVRKIKPVNGDLKVSGTVKITQTVSADNSRHVNFYEIDWSDITSVYKQMLIFNDNAYNNRMVQLSRETKEFFLNELIADVILSQNTEVGVELRNVVDGTVKLTQSESDIYFITYSLGSKIVFDTFFENIQPVEKRLVYRSIVARTQSFFMLANQIALLDLGPDDTFWQQLSTIQNERGPSSQKHWMVAFSDVNDLLSYGLRTNSQNLSESFVNVLVTNEKCSRWVPFVGNLVNPKTAHVGYGGNENVLDILVNGYQIEDD